MRRVSFENALGLAALAVLLGVALWLRLRGLGDGSLWLDEAVSWMQSKDGLVDLVRRTAADNYPPLHNFLLFVSMHALGDSEWSLRLPSVILGVANIGVIYWLATFTVGRMPGLLAALLLALSPFHFDYSQEARGYALLAFAATLYAAVGFWFARHPSPVRALGVAGAGLVLAYSHTFGVVNWIALAMGLTLVVASAHGDRRQMRLWVGANAIVAIGFAPWAAILLLRAATIALHGFWIPYPTPPVILETFTDMAGGPAWALLVVPGLLLALPSLRERTLRVLWIWMLLPVLAALLVSLVSTPIFMHRYLIGAVPPALLLAALGYATVLRSWRLATTGLVAAAALALAWIGADRYTVERVDWRSAAGEATSLAGPDGCLIVTPSWVAWPLRYYGVPSCFIPAAGVKELPTEIPAHRLVFLTDVLDDNKEPGEVLDALEARGWLPTGRSRYGHINLFQLESGSQHAGLTNTGSTR